MPDLRGKDLLANIPHLAGFYLPWQVLVLTGLAVLVIMAFSALLSIRRVLILEPMAVVRG